MNDNDFALPKHYLAERRFSIQHMRKTGATAMPRPHSHDEVELYYLLHGERLYFVDDRIVTVRKGEMILLPPRLPHATASSQRAQFERVLIHYDPSLLPAALAEPESARPSFRLYRFSLREQLEIERVLRRLMEECERADKHYETLALALLTELNVLLRRAQPETQANRNGNPVHEKITEIATFVRQRYREGLTLEETAKRFYISSSYLSRIFHRFTGFHFREYLIHIRIREAQKLLTETRCSVQEIAYAVGFEYLSHFNKTFKKATGLTPMQYRKAAVQPAHSSAPAYDTLRQ
ncbi:AraC family transcriptional regulator [Paenibacillus sp.]|uniref:helix-turn-helix transcriptional regulator n=1 Tax=Paenibacillus sp. TaxID=58172 RepID=UPI0028122BB4|nr:AraC family transcriptional regulator [Paenibacillus sp.]